MARVQFSQRPLIVFVAAIVVQVILISAQVNTTAGIPFIQVVTFGAFSEVQRGTMNGFNGVRGLWTGYVALRDVQAENEALKRELQTLQVRLQEERAQAKRSDSLQQLLDLRQRAGLETVASEIIAGPADLEFRDMTIDKGNSDGLRQDMAVISPAGVVGRVILSSPRASRVQMLIDRNAAAGAMIERTRAQGIVMGQGATLRMEYVPGTADVKQGDLVVTSGIDKIYPKGFVIGTVDVVNRGPGTFHDITVRPAVDFSRLEDVLVVTSPPPAVTAEQIDAEAEALAEAQRAAQHVSAPDGTAQNASPQAASPRNAGPRGASSRNASPRNITPRRPRPAAPANVPPAAPLGHLTPPVPGHGPLSGGAPLVAGAHE